jgi:hypothetical protein
MELLENVFTVFVSYYERNPADSHNSEPRVPNVVTVSKVMAERKMQVNMREFALRRRGLQDLAEGRCYLSVRVS